MRTTQHAPKVVDAAFDLCCYPGRMSANGNLAALKRLADEEDAAILELENHLRERRAFRVQLQHRIEYHECLADQPRARRRSPKPAENGLGAAVERVMAEATGKMTAADVTEAVQRNGYTFAGRTPKEVLVRAALNRGARAERWSTTKRKGRVYYEVKEGALKDSA
jgi:hypothetical protein